MVTLEKVLRLLELLQETARDQVLSDRLVLKGGTGLWCMEPRWCDRPFPGWISTSKESQLQIQCTEFFSSLPDHFDVRSGKPSRPWEGRCNK